NRVLARDLDLVCEAVRGGRSLAVAVADGGHLPVLAVHMIRIGEESGELAAMLLRVADTFEREAARAVQRMLAAMVPMVTLARARVGGLGIGAVLVPLYDMAGAIGGLSGAFPGRGTTEGDDGQADSGWCWQAQWRTPQPGGHEPAGDHHRDRADW